MHASESPARSAPKEPRAASRAKPRQATRAYARRRRGIPAQLAAAESANPALQFWNEHAVKTGIIGFWLWFGVANWHGLQTVSAELLQRLLG